MLVIGVLTVCLLASSFGDPLKFAVLRAKRKNLLTTAQLIVETFFEEVDDIFTHLIL
jgi:hypothetical protein